MPLNEKELKKKKTFKPLSGPIYKTKYADSKRYSPEKILE